MPVFDAAAVAFPGGTPKACRHLRALVALAALLLGGCAWYHREPLAPHDTSTSARSLERIQIDASRVLKPTRQDCCPTRN